LFNISDLLQTSSRLRNSVMLHNPRSKTELCCNAIYTQRAPRVNEAPPQSWPDGSGIHGIEEFRVVLGVAELVEQEVDRIHGAHRIEDPAQHVHLLQELRIGDQLFLAGAGARDVDRREGPLVRNLAVEDQFGVTGAFEFFEDHFVHSAAGIDQCGRDDGERTALFDVTRGAKEPLWPLQRIGVDTAGQHLAG